MLRNNSRNEKSWLNQKKRNKNRQILPRSMEFEAPVIRSVATRKFASNRNATTKRRKYASRLDQSSVFTSDNALSTSKSVLQ